MRSKLRESGSIVSTIEDTVYRELNANIIIEEVKRREATCSKLKSVLLSESINSIIYRERKNILFCYMAERNREENTSATSTLNSAS